MTLSRQNRALRLQVEDVQMRYSDLKVYFEKATAIQASLASQNGDLESQSQKGKEQAERLHLELDALRNEVSSAMDTIKQVQVELERVSER
jgi:FtsZ-binding cell division protein ZapB